MNCCRPLEVPRLYAYVVRSVTTGLRTEELRALRWNEVDLDAGTVAVYRAVRPLRTRRHVGAPGIDGRPLAPRLASCKAGGCQRLRTAPPLSGPEGRTVQRPQCSR